LDSILLANERVDYVKKAKNSGVFVKVMRTKSWSSTNLKHLHK